jgi:hypothetical protein
MAPAPVHPRPPPRHVRPQCRRLWRKVHFWGTRDQGRRVDGVVRGFRDSGGGTGMFGSAPDRSSLSRSPAERRQAIPSHLLGGTSPGDITTWKPGNPKFLKKLCGEGATPATTPPRARENARSRRSEGAGHPKGGGYAPVAPVFPIGGFLTFAHGSGRRLPVRPVRMP